MNLLYKNAYGKVKLTEIVGQRSSEQTIDPLQLLFSRGNVHFNIYPLQPNARS